MAEPTISEIFGISATQDGSVITIAKADLVATGLTPSTSNTAESLLAAIFLKAKGYLTPANFDINLDQSIVIETGFDAIIQRIDANGNTISYRQNQLTLSLSKLDGDSIDPDDY